MFVEDRHRQRRAQVDMSPLVDVVFLLLIFFAVTTTFLDQTGMDLELPESSTATASESAAMLVELGGDGALLLQGEKVTLEQLQQRVSELSEEERARVTMRADRNVALSFAVDVFDALRNAGVAGISMPMIATER